MKSRSFLPGIAMLLLSATPAVPQNLWQTTPALQLPVRRYTANKPTDAALAEQLKAIGNNPNGIYIIMGDSPGCPMGPISMYPRERKLAEIINDNLANPQNGRVLAVVLAPDDPIERLKLSQDRNGKQLIPLYDADRKNLPVINAFTFTAGGDSAILLPQNKTIVMKGWSARQLAGTFDTLMRAGILKSGDPKSLVRRFNAGLNDDQKVGENPSRGCAIRM